MKMLHLTDQARLARRRRCTSQDPSKVSGFKSLLFEVSVCAELKSNTLKSLSANPHRTQVRLGFYMSQTTFPYCAYVVTQDR